MIIALTGNNGVGKDTVAGIIQTMLNNKIFLGYIIEQKDYLKNEPLWEIKKFADLPNELYTRITNVKFLSLPSTNKEIERERFINFCQKNKEVFGRYVWVDSLMRDYTKEKKWIISDLRFYEEYLTLDTKNTTFVRITRNGYNNGTKVLDPHEMHFTIENNGDMIDLKDKVRDILNQLELL